ncbi:hypothetical protein PQ610_03945 [Tardisphaera miroshnichenkoae]
MEVTRSNDKKLICLSQQRRESEVVAAKDLRGRLGPLAVSNDDVEALFAEVL